MKHTVKMLRVEGKKDRDECIRFLKTGRVRNLYLFEGIATSYPLFRNYSLLVGERTVGVLHTKNGMYLHLSLLPGLDRETVRSIVGLIRKRFPGFEMLFGDEGSISLLLKDSSFSPFRTVRFLFMETDGVHFTPSSGHRGLVPSPAHARLLLPLQIQYEIEEVGASRDQIQDAKVLRILEKRIQRDEVSAVYHGGVPVAVAGVNARFECCCQIGSVYVVPEFRGKGYGRAVVSFHVHRLLKRYDRIALFVQERNVPAIRIYERLGFTRSGALLQAYV